jgi:hypothetical protein
MFQAHAADAPEFGWHPLVISATLANSVRADKPVAAMQYDFFRK